MYFTQLVHSKKSCRYVQVLVFHNYMYLRTYCEIESITSVFSIGNG